MTRPGRKTPWQVRARYQRKKCPNRLRPWQVQAMFDADYTARLAGWPLNAFITVYWSHTGEGTANAERRLAIVRKQLSGWLTRRGEPTAWLWVHENPGGRFNSHLALHLDPTFTGEVLTLLEKWTSATSRRAVHFVKRWTPRGRDRLMQYLTKGTDAVTAAKAGGRARAQGVVMAKRCGWSESIGAAARISLEKQSDNCAETCKRHSDGTKHAGTPANGSGRTRLDRQSSIVTIGSLKHLPVS